MKLNLYAAAELYDLMKPYLPEIQDGDLQLGMLNRLVGNMVAIDPSSFMKSLVIMTGMTEDQLKQFEANDLKLAFLDGIKDNNLYEMQMILGEMAHG